MCFVLGFVKIGSQDCQRCCLGFSKLYSGIDEILIRDCQSCGYGLSKFLLEIVKTVIKNCQNCGLGMSKLWFRCVKINNRENQDYLNCLLKLSILFLHIVKIVILDYPISARHNFYLSCQFSLVVFKAESVFSLVTLCKDLFVTEATQYSVKTGSRVEAN